MPVNVAKTQIKRAPAIIYGQFVGGSERSFVNLRKLRFLGKQLCAYAFRGKFGYLKKEKLRIIVF